MANKTSKQKKPTSASQKKKSSKPFITRQCIKLILIVLVVSSAYVMWLDYRIYNEFEGRKWSVPARVYSRPAEVYTGQQYTISKLIRRLELSGYQQTNEITLPGEYNANQNRVLVYLRSFDYWDGKYSANLYDIKFQNGVISRIIDKKLETNIAILRIDPVLIGKIYPDHNEDRVLISLIDVPEFLIKALTTAEDRGFYHHHGIDFKGILRAFWVNIRRGEFAQGGSTITQQLVKNYFLTAKRTLTRKFNEMIMALLLERRYSKDEILTAYLNEVYLGQDGARAIHGFGTAAEFYFNKPIGELSQEQLVLLVAMVRGASFYNPRRSPERIIARRNLVLDVMEDQGHISSASNKMLKTRLLGVTLKPVKPGKQYAAFLDVAKQQLLNEYDIDALKNDGLIIYSTLQPLFQSDIDVTVEKRLQSLDAEQNYPPGSLEAAIVIINPVNGNVLGLYGGRNYLYSGFNHATQAKRPIGSLIKPFVYLAALSRPDEFSLLSTLSDKKVNLLQHTGETWAPENYDRQEHGKVSVIEALVNSYNLATVNLGMTIGVNNVVSILNSSGVTNYVHAYPSILLGALELTPLEVTQLYQILANGGYKVPINAIQEVFNRDGIPLTRNQLNVEQAWDEKTVFLINYLLSKVVQKGTAKRLSSELGENLDLAGKTGTSDGSRDSWFAAYGEDYLAVSWIGKDDNSPTSLTGASGAMLLWADIAKLVSLKPIRLFEPPGISWIEDVHLRFNGTCTDFGRVPYLDTDRTDPDILCQQGSNKSESILNNIKRWFQ
jgi:penicillin-binding protein 1B